MKELRDVLDELGGCCEKLAEIAYYLKDCNAGETAPANEEPKEKSPATSYTFEDVRKKLSGLAGKGHRDEVLALINEYGVSKLSEIPEDKFNEVMEKAEVMGNA